MPMPHPDTLTQAQREPGWYWVEYTTRSPHGRQILYFTGQVWVSDPKPEPWDESYDYHDPDIVLRRIPSPEELDARDALLRRVLDTGHSAGCALMDTTIYHMNRKCDCPLKDVEALLAGGK